MERTLKEKIPEEKRFAGVKVLLGVTGGIAAYKACHLVRILIEEGAEVQVVLTERAHQFITPLTLATLSGRPVLTDLFPQPPPPQPIHLTPASWADLAIVAPATADFIARLAHGLADDLLTTILLSFKGPLLLAPTMNPRMWENQFLQENLHRLKEQGIRTVGPEWGKMASLEEGEGWGRMSEPEAIADAAEELLIPDRWLAGKRVIVTSGPTREALDPVRYLSNRSSGKMGDALARQAHLLGAEVYLIRGNGALGDPPRGPRVIEVESAQDMAGAVKSLFASSHLLIMAAAVADWRPEQVSSSKIKRSEESLSLSLVANEDILAWAGRHKQSQVVVGFALETEQHLENAQAKLTHKGADLILLNDPTQPHSQFGGDTTQITILSRNGEVNVLPLMSKREAARRVLEEIKPFLMV